MIPFLLTCMLAYAPVAPDGGTVVMKGQKFMAEVARTVEEQRLGLMHRQYLAKDRCMIFIYTREDFRSIWMKNCLISLDVAWVKEDGAIVDMVENVPPCSPMKGDDCPTYGGAVTSRHFVEFPVGTFRRLGIHKGDKLGWNLTLSDGTKVVGGLAVPADRSRGKKSKRN